MTVASAPASWRIMESVLFPTEYPDCRVLDEIAQAGYAGTELGPYGFLPTDPTELCQQLDKRKLTLCSAFVEVCLAERERLRRSSSRWSALQSYSAKLAATCLFFPTKKRRAMRPRGSLRRHAAIFVQPAPMARGETDNLQSSCLLCQARNARGLPSPRGHARRDSRRNRSVVLAIFGRRIGLVPRHGSLHLRRW